MVDACWATAAGCLVAEKWPPSLRRGCCHVARGRRRCYHHHRCRCRCRCRFRSELERLTGRVGLAEGSEVAGIMSPEYLRRTLKLPGNFQAHGYCVCRGCCRSIGSTGGRRYLYWGRSPSPLRHEGRCHVVRGRCRPFVTGERAYHHWREFVVAFRR